MRFTSMRNKLFILFSLLGSINVLMAYGFFYFTSIRLLEENSFQHMASIRAQASQKINLYLENLKYSSKQEASRTFISGKFYGKFLKSSLTGVYYLNSSNGVTVLKGGPISQTILSRIKEQEEFYPLGNDGFMLMISHMPGNLVFTYNFDGLTEILTEYEGLGDSGEIYLVGQDNLIRSGPRHNSSGEPIILKNASVELGKRLASGVHKVRDYRNVEVLSAFSPLKVDHLEYILLSEIDREEVLKPLNRLFPKIFVICLLFCVISIVLAYFLSTKILHIFDKRDKTLDNHEKN